MDSILQVALITIRQEAGVEVAFGGFVPSGSDRFTIQHFSGELTRSLYGITISKGEGLGGVVLAEGRSSTVIDYLSDTRITHPYDPAVAAERLQSIACVPILMNGMVRAVMYGAMRRPLAIGPAKVALMQSAALQAAFDLAVHEAVAKKMQELETLAVIQEAKEQPSQPELERFRIAHAELREIARDMSDEHLRDRLEAVISGLTVSPSGSNGLRNARFENARFENTVRLSEREIDVLALVATGAINAEIANRLGLKSETVKSYLRNIMRKLGVHRRIEAVSRARQLGLLL